MPNYIPTRDLSRTEWLALRKRGIGASERAIALGLSKYKTPQQLYFEKIADVLEPEEIAPQMKRGTRLEEVVAEMYTEETGRKVIRDFKMRIHPEMDFLYCSLDRIILPSNGEGRGLLEAKTVSMNAFRAWETTIPLPYFVQVQGQLDVTQMTWADLVVLNIDTWELRTFRVERDDDFNKTANAMLVDFWQNHVIPRIPPDPTVADLETVMAPEGSVIEADDQIVADLSTLAQRRFELKAIEGSVDEIEERVKLFLGSHEMLTHAGKILATWKKAKDSLSYDTKRMLLDMPTVVAKYAVTKPGSRRFLLKGGE